MSLGRRKVRLDEAARWVFNRMADVYDARPMYPRPLLDALAQLACGETGARPAARPRVGDLGAGTGHLALPLAARGFEVVAVEPARLMLQRLEDAAAAQGLSVRACHASAEQLPLADRSLDLVIVSDALHFLDAQLASQEIDRVLMPAGALAVITCEFGATSFMREVERVIHDAVPRRPRALGNQLVHVSSITGVPLDQTVTFHDDTPVGHDTLEHILRSISFIGPAMNPQRFARFRDRIQALSESPVWSRTFVLRMGSRRKRVPRRAAVAETQRSYPSGDGLV